ncbi:MAG: hypothetical protein ACLQO1_25780 [Steroidobacteraceae bacterium]
MTTTLFLAPPNPVTVSAVFSDSANSYQASANGPVQIADSDFLAALDSGFIPVGGIGPTSGRAAWLAGPAAAIWSGNLPNLPVAPPLWFYDQTLGGKMIFYDVTTSTWRDPANGNSV